MIRKSYFLLSLLLDPPKETTVAISRATGGKGEGSNITLTCSSESVPPASSYTWFRIDRDTITQLNTSARSIYFRHVTREDDAGFYCTARNPLGIGRSTIVHLCVECTLHTIQILGIRAAIFILAVIATVTGVRVWDRRPAKGSREPVESCEDAGVGNQRPDHLFHRTTD